MAYRHRDRDNHRRSLVVWESVLKPPWIFRFQLRFGLSTLGGMGETPAVICSSCCMSLRDWTNLVAATALGLVDSLVVELLQL